MIGDTRRCMAVDALFQSLKARAIIGDGQHTSDPHHHLRQALHACGADVTHAPYAIDALHGTIYASVAIDNQHPWSPWSTCPIISKLFNIATSKTPRFFQRWANRTEDAVSAKRVATTVYAAGIGLVARTKVLAKRSTNPTLVTSSSPAAQPVALAGMSATV